MSASRRSGRAVEAHVAAWRWALDRWDELRRIESPTAGERGALRDLERRIVDRRGVLELYDERHRPRRNELIRDAFDRMLVVLALPEEQLEGNEAMFDVVAAWRALDDLAIHQIRYDQAVPKRFMERDFEGVLRAARGTTPPNVVRTAQEVVGRFAGMSWARVRDVVGNEPADARAARLMAEHADSRAMLDSHGPAGPSVVLRARTTKRR